MTDEQKAEFEYLKWFYVNADFGPADSDVRYCMNYQYTKQTGLPVPEGCDEE